MSTLHKQGYEFPIRYSFPSVGMNPVENPPPNCPKATFADIVVPAIVIKATKPSSKKVFFWFDLIVHIVINLPLKYHASI